MKSKLYEGMPRTQSPQRGSPIRLAVLLTLAALLLALGWTIFSPTSETGEHRAQAQTPEPEGGEEGASPEDPHAEGDFVAFGEPHNPFDPVVALTETENGDGDDGAGPSGDNGSSDGGSNQSAQTENDETEKLNEAQPAGDGNERSALNNNDRDRRVQQQGQNLGAQEGE
ncbi:MAG: hypothetical protein L0G70_03905, partial [Rubrobacter sp.]|nr:hypothetical protein [Rubrobacter sp.]